MTVYNKVTINNQTLIDLSSDTVTPNTLLNGVTAHDNSGAIITGTYVPSGGTTINNQNKTVRPSEEEQSITADNGYTGLGTVTIESIDDEYIGSAINRRDETDLTSTNNVVTVPAGYYAEEETKTITTISHAAPTISVNTSTGVITATHVQGGGYVSEDTQTATENLSIQAAATIIPGSSAQTAVAANKYTTGAVTVAAVPTETKSITTNGTYAPTTGKYFSSVTVNIPSVNISQDANGYIVLDDESGYGGGGGYTINQVIGRTELTGAVVDNTVTALPVGCLSMSKITSFSSTSAISNPIGYAFYYCDQLKTVDMPNFAHGTTNGATSMFQGCSALETINIPKWRRAGGNMFQYCTSLQMLVLPSADYQLGGYFANGCTSLTTVDIGGGWSGGLCSGNGFSQTGIKTLILRRTGSILTTAANNFGSSPLAATGSGGDIYVPNSLLSAYQSATNWSALNATWHAIEGSYYETHYADGTPIE